MPTRHLAAMRTPVLMQFFISISILHRLKSYFLQEDLDEEEAENAKLRRELKKAKRKANRALLMVDLGL